MIPYRTAAVNTKTGFPGLDSRENRDADASNLLSRPETRPQPKEDPHEMALTLSDVKRIAHLARIEVTEAEAGHTLERLTGIFALIEEMQSVDTKGVEPMSHAQDVVQRLREDEVTETNQRELFQSVAPQVEGGLYLVPKVIE